MEIKESNIFILWLTTFIVGIGLAILSHITGSLVINHLSGLFIGFALGVAVIMYFGTGKNRITSWK